jgi:hypothetical protein
MIPKYRARTRGGGTRACRRGVERGVPGSRAPCAGPGPPAARPAPPGRKPWSAVILQSRRLPGGRHTLKQALFRGTGGGRRWFPAGRSPRGGWRGGSWRARGISATTGKSFPSSSARKDAGRCAGTAMTAAPNGAKRDARIFVEEAVMNGAVFIDRAKVEKAIDRRHGSGSQSTLSVRRRRSRRRR